MILYYAVKINDANDKNINVLIDSCFDLMLPCIIANPDELLPNLYKFNNFENFVVSSLRFKGEESVRKTVSNTYKLICNNCTVNSKYTKNQYKCSPVKKQEEQKEQTLTKENEEKKEVDPDVAPYEDPRVYFLKVLLKNLPTTNQKSEKCEETFNLLTTLIKLTSNLFLVKDPYSVSSEGEDIDAEDIF